MSALTLWIVSCRQSLRTRVGRSDRGATLVEYALLVTLIAVVCIIAVAIVGNNASANFSNVGSAIQ
jgi:pilus assembly protein Flp/PilA